MKRIISLLSITLILFLAVGCQSDKHAEKNWNSIYIQEVVDDYNRIVVELSKKEGLDDPALLTLSKEAERINGDKYEAVGTFNGAKYQQLSAIISSDKSIMITLESEKEDITTPYNEKLAKIIFTAAIETVKSGQSLEIERELQLIDEDGIFRLPPYQGDPDGVVNMNPFSKDDFNFTYIHHNPREHKAIEIWINKKN